MSETVEQSVLALLRIPSRQLEIFSAEQATSPLTLLQPTPPLYLHLSKQWRLRYVKTTITTRTSILELSESRILPLGNAHSRCSPRERQLFHSRSRLTFYHSVLQPSKSTGPTLGLSSASKATPPLLSPTSRSATMMRAVASRFFPRRRRPSTSRNTAAS